MTSRGKFVFTVLILFVVALGTWKWWDRISPAKTLPYVEQPTSVNTVSNQVPIGNQNSSHLLQTNSIPTSKSKLLQLNSPVEIGIAYGTEKKRWLEWAVEEFARTPAGANIQINLIPLGSIEAAQAILNGDKRIHVWSPASSVFSENFNQEFQLRYNREPFHKMEQLAMTPMVFVSWKERFDAFTNKFPNVTFSNISLAIKERGGWSAIASKPEWGFFKYAHTHPNRSNSGLISLMLMAYDYHFKVQGLSLVDIQDARFQTWMIDIENAVVDLPNSTGLLMHDMILKGPSSYDIILVYENVAIDYLKNAEGRWGQLQITYPSKNMWSNNPYYILNTPWSAPNFREASQLFLDFLMSETSQKVALKHGFRPGNVNVPILFEGSPFMLYQKYGLRIDVPLVCEPPAPEVIHNILVGWNNAVRKR